MSTLAVYLVKRLVVLAVLVTLALDAPNTAQAMAPHERCTQVHCIFPPASVFRFPDSEVGVTGAACVTIGGPCPGYATNVDPKTTAVTYTWNGIPTGVSHYSSASYSVVLHPDDHSATLTNATNNQHTQVGEGGALPLIALARPLLSDEWMRGRSGNPLGHCAYTGGMAWRNLEFDVTLFGDGVDNTHGDRCLAWLQGTLHRLLQRAQNYAMHTTSGNGAISGTTNSAPPKQLSHAARRTALRAYVKELLGLDNNCLTKIVALDNAIQQGYKGADLQPYVGAVKAESAHAYPFVSADYPQTFDNSPTAHRLAHDFGEVIQAYAEDASAEADYVTSPTASNTERYGSVENLLEQDKADRTHILNKIACAWNLTDVWPCFSS